MSSNSEDFISGILYSNGFSILAAYNCMLTWGNNMPVFENRDTHSNVQYVETSMNPENYGEAQSIEDLIAVMR